MSARGSSTRPTVRRELRPADREAVRTLLDGTGFFNREELEVAMELVDDRLAHGEASHYRFLVAELDGTVVGYACWGPILGTAESADLYWIAVDRRTQGRGVGRALLAEAESWMAASGRPAGRSTSRRAPSTSPAATPSRPSSRTSTRPATPR